jgi:AcrR family transcriptional regulator
LSLAFRSDAPAGRRRVAFLTRTEIVEAAARVLERDGYDALNLRAVAAALGVRAPALYRHIAGRAELDDLLFDHLMIGCAPTASGDDWREDLVAVCGAWRRRLIEKRDATRIALAQVSIGPNIAPLLEAALAALSRSGLGEADVAEAYHACVTFVHGFASAEANLKRLESADAVRLALPQPDWTRSYPNLSRLAGRLAGPLDADASFRFGIESLIAGVERRVEERPNITRAKDDLRSEMG